MGRAKQNKVQICLKVKPETKVFINDLALLLGHAANVKGNVVGAFGEVLDLLAAKEYRLVRSDVYDRLTKAAEKNTGPTQT